MLDDDLIRAAEATLAICRLAGRRLGTAESCTGGLIAAALTAIAGSSDVVGAGFVTYSNAAKTSLLGVPAGMIERVGAVSEEVARAMAEGALARLPELGIAVSVTGIAGPGGGSETKPVGLVHFGLAYRGAATIADRQVFAGDRTEIRRRAALHALDLVRRSAAKPA